MGQNFKKATRTCGTAIIHLEPYNGTIFIKLYYFAVLSTNVDYGPGGWINSVRTYTVSDYLRYVIVGMLIGFASISCGNNVLNIFCTGTYVVECCLKNLVSAGISIKLCHYDMESQHFTAIVKQDAFRSGRAYIYTCK